MCLGTVKEGIEQCVSFSFYLLYFSLISLLLTKNKIISHSMTQQKEMI